MGDKSRGIYNKFIVHRTDGKDKLGEKHENCNYFVLDLTHDKYAISALIAYSKACESEYPLLSKDLNEMITKFSNSMTNIKED